MSFSELGLDGWVLDQVRAVGFKAPTDIQYHCIPPILEGRDCLGCSKTGSGKTAAFALPILQRLSEDPFGIFAVVLTPTRELAFQIGEQFRAFGKPVNLRDVVVVGGMDMMKQSLALAQHPHVVIATPGRLADHIKSTDTFSLKKIKFIVS
jgi:ATP-dependent RNA helicase DDX49/DBP8